MDAVDKPFFESLRDIVFNCLDNTFAKDPVTMKKSKEEIWDQMKKSAISNINYCFTFLPGVKGRRWPDLIWNVWKRDQSREVFRGGDREYVESNFIYNKIHGTTFSGHPTKTTLGNTIRSIMYAYFYL